MGEIISINQPALKEHADAIRTLGKQTLANVIEIGRRLTECKEIVGGHGKWYAWLNTEFKWGETTAQKYMRIAKVFGNPNPQGPVDLDLLNLNLPIDTLYLLAAPSTPDTARDEIVNRVKGGEKMKHKEVADVVRETKKNAPPKSFGLRALILEKIKDAGDKGLITSELQKMLSNDHHLQTINTTLNTLAKTGAVRDSGKKRHSDSRGGRDSIVYVLGDGTVKAPEKQQKSNQRSRSHVPKKIIFPTPTRAFDLTREQVDPEFKGTPIEWVDKYGHVQVMTAQQYATMRFGDWVSNARALAKRWRELPEIRNVDHNWLRAPNPTDVTRLEEALEYLRPKIAELEALFACASAAIKKKHQ